MIEGISNVSNTSGIVLKMLRIQQQWKLCQPHNITSWMFTIRDQRDQRWRRSIKLWWQWSVAEWFAVQPSLHLLWEILFFLIFALFFSLDSSIDFSASNLTVRMLFCDLNSQNSVQPALKRWNERLQKKEISNIASLSIVTVFRVLTTQNDPEILESMTSVVAAKKKSLAAWHCRRKATR